MAIRPAYLVSVNEIPLVKVEDFEFKWHPGLSVSQKQKSIDELHSSILKIHPDRKILEVSSKSRIVLGTLLSAFNLTFSTKKYKKTISVETAFQSSKVFTNGGPYYDLLDKTSAEAKKDLRIKNSGNLTHFIFFNEQWSINPPTAFYDWLYMNALNQHRNIVEEVLQYNCFTDIEFNPEKSINCQAHSVALFVSLHRKNMLAEALSSKEKYIDTICKFNNSITPSTAKIQSISKQYSLL